METEIDPNGPGEFLVSREGKIVLTIIVVFVLSIAGYIGWTAPTMPAGYQATEATRTPPAANPLIRVEVPRQNAMVRSPFSVSGEARGTWYFEASFPVRLLDADGTVLAATPAQAQGDWMTDAFVPFKVTLTFKEPKGVTGVLVLKKDNPSGDPARDDEIRIPVRFR